MILEVGASTLRTLLDFHRRPVLQGREGGGRVPAATAAGLKAGDLIIKVPNGTVVLDKRRCYSLADLIGTGTRFIAAAGGKGRPRQRGSRVAEAQGARLRAQGGTRRSIAS